jgi:peptidoglycan/LPS O-acetylase OafA/YrhL
MSAASSPPAADAPARVLPYRPEVDGLRALAVLSVLLFHAQLGPVGGGFVGVDVFFVISGFLITGILLREQARGAFSLAGFYARRARRIGPALLAVCAACVPAAWWIMDGAELHAFARLLAGVAVAGSNIVLAATTGYFDLPAEDQPLLHTWSLGVEEQFYLLFPLLLLATRRWTPRRRVALLGTLAFASLLAAEWGWRRHSGANFFLPQGRAWELLAGAIAAFAAMRAAALARGTRELLAAAGLVAVLASFVLLDRYTPSPSLRLLPAVLGTAALLLVAHGDTRVGRLLAWKPLVAVGLVSYSAYLWHQPLLAFARLALDAPLPLAWRWGVVALTFVLAALSWKFVEQPWRRAPRRGERRTLAFAAALAVAGLALGLAGTLAADRAVTPLPANVQAAFRRPPRADACFDIPQARKDPSRWCAIHPGAEAQPSFVLFGDSHALQLLETFEAAARAAGRSGVFTGFSGCPPLLDVVLLTEPEGSERDCAALNRRMLSWVSASGVRDVYLVAKWSYYTDLWNGTRYLQALGRSRAEKRSVENSRRAFEAGYAATVRAYAALGVRLHVLQQVPQQLYEPRAIYERVLKAPGEHARLLAQWSVPRARHLALQAFPDRVLRRADLPSREVLDADDLLCDAERCLLGTPSQPYYQDRSHLSAAGADRLLTLITPSLRAGLTPPEGGGTISRP